MWAAGLMEGLMWRAVTDTGMLSNPAFMDIVNRLNPFYWLRLVGGLLYLTGVLMMSWNLIRTVFGAQPRLQPVTAAPAAS
jgi:cbb3-type cytochrome oxidase subunit 1